MRTRNPNYERGVDTVLGRTSPGRTGSRGITFRDGATEAHPVVDLLVIGGTVTDNDDGTAILTIDGAATVVGTVSADGSPFTISSGTDHRAFPGVAWLTNPTDAEHTTGDTFLIVYRHGTDHLTAGKIVGRICTITATSPWTYTVGSAFDIEDVANDLRVDDGVSVLDIGGGAYRAVIAAREYNGTVNLNPHILVCDVASASMTSTSTWTRYNVALSGHTQDLLSGRVLKLLDGTYLVAAYYLSGATSTTAVVKSSSITDWSSPTIVTVVANGYNEVDVEEMPDGTLIAHMRNVPDTHIGSSTSTNVGATWSTAANIFTGTYWPMFRRLTSGIGVHVAASGGGSLDTTVRQTTSAITDTGWGSETIIDSTAGRHCGYATLLQLDNTHALVIYALETDGALPTDSDLYSQVLTDSSVIGAGGITGVTVREEGTALATLATGLDFVGSGVTASGTGTTKTITIAAGLGPLLLQSDPGTPIVFDDILQASDGADLLYASEP